MSANLTPDTDAPPPTSEERNAARERRMTWYGYLADDNVEHVAQRIRNLLDGRRYSFVSLNTEHVAVTMPEVRTGQRVKRNRPDGDFMSVHRIGDLSVLGGGDTWTSAGLSISDTYGAWGLHSPHATEADAVADAHDNTKRHRCTAVVIEGGRESDDVGRRARIEVRQYNHMSPPQMLAWVIAVEPSREDEE